MGKQELGSLRAVNRTKSIDNLVTQTLRQAVKMELRAPDRFLMGREIVANMLLSVELELVAESVELVRGDGECRGVHGNNIANPLSLSNEEAIYFSDCSQPSADKLLAITLFFFARTAADALAASFARSVRALAVMRLAVVSPPREPIARR